MNPFRKKKMPALPGPDDPLNALAVKAALAKLDAHYADIVEFRANIATWQKQLDDFIANGDPMDHNRAIGAAAMKTRLEMAPNYLARAEEKTPPLVEAVISEVRSFETRILAVCQDEVASLDALIVPVVLPFCRDRETALRVARGCTPYSYIPHGRQSTLLGRSFMESDAFWLLGHESYPFARVVDSPGGLARAEEQLRVRVADLLTAYDGWKERGGRWVPKDFAPTPAAPEPVVTSEGEIPQSPEADAPPEVVDAAQ